MEALEAMRFDAFQKIYAISKDLKASTIIEHDIWSSICKHGTLYGIPVWTYGLPIMPCVSDQEHEITLFETDRPEVHFREAAAAYNDKLNLFIATTSIKGFQDLTSITKWHSIPLHDIEALTDYGLWRDANLASIKKAKTVLEEREETTDAFISCRKCKSNAVDTEQKQTRSADEPMTIFCSCRKCGSRWRIE